jgi:hypothetical protein
MPKSSKSFVLTFSICAPIPQGRFDLSLPILLMLAALQEKIKEKETVLKIH